MTLPDFGLAPPIEYTSERPAYGVPTLSVAVTVIVPVCPTVRVCLTGCTLSVVGTCARLMIE